MTTNDAVTPARRLALEISNCGELEGAFATPGHPCSEVATWQISVIPEAAGVKHPSGTRIHRPEPWTGDLAHAPILFLASNPSWGPDEAYPDWTEAWSEEQIEAFGTERFLASAHRPYGATDGPGLSDQDRTYGRDGSLSDVVGYWREVRGQVATILGKPLEQVSAHSDYVMTEMVHCKSFNEIGVASALSHCASRWLDRIFRLSPAGLVIVAGKQPAQHFRALHPEIPQGWGGYAGSGDWPKSKDALNERVAKGTWTIENQRKHTITLTLGGRERTVVWLPRQGDSRPRQLGLPGLIDPALLAQWRAAAQG